MTKPDFVTMWTNFARINVSVKDVGKKIGGKVQYNIDQGIFQNACAIRMSYALNYSGVPVFRSAAARGGRLHPVRTKNGIYSKLLI